MAFRGAASGGQGLWDADGIALVKHGPVHVLVQRGLEGEGGKCGERTCGTWERGLEHG